MQSMPSGLVRSTSTCVAPRSSADLKGTGSKSCASASSAPLTLCQHTSAYVSIRQHPAAYVRIRQHTSASVGIRRHTSAYGSIRQHPSAYVSIQATRIRRHTAAYGSIRQHTSAYKQRALSALPQRLLLQFLYFCCTSKASKLSTLSCTRGPAIAGRFIEACMHL